ncbi:MAG: PASTA domain-containing protein [Bacteroidales bacterium]|nr:PASTA domain-containing protein [Bacteroidales bacterium]
MKKIDSEHLGYHILLAAAITIVALIVIVVCLRVFTRHGKEFKMPSYIGQNAEELTQRGRQEGFIFVVSEHRYEDGAVPGTVLKQDPSAGEKVKRGRKVYLTIAADEPPTIKMPELREIPFSQAKIMLEAQGLVLDRTIEKTSPYENLVLEVLYKGHSIASGTEIKMGEKITLVIGKDIQALPDSADVETSDEQ